jgi:hypothetical protein
VRTHARHWPAEHSTLRTEDGHRHPAQRHTGASFRSMAMSASEACKRLFPLIEQVNDPQEPVQTGLQGRHRLPRLHRRVALPGDNPSPALSRPTPSACRAASPTPKPAAPKSRNRLTPSTTPREDQRHPLTCSFARPCSHQPCVRKIKSECDASGESARPPRRAQYHRPSGKQVLPVQAG